MGWSWRPDRPRAAGGSQASSLRRHRHGAWRRRYRARRRARARCWRPPSRHAAFSADDCRPHNAPCPSPSDAVAAGQRLADARPMPDMAGSRVGLISVVMNGLPAGKKRRGGQKRECGPAFPPRPMSARATMIRCASSILKALSPDGFAPLSAASAARRNADGSHPRAGQQRFRCIHPPRFCGDATEREPRLLDRAVFDDQQGCGPKPGRTHRDVRSRTFR